MAFDFQLYLANIDLPQHSEQWRQAFRRHLFQKRQRGRQEIEIEAEERRQRDKKKVTLEVMRTQISELEAQKKKLENLRINLFKQYKIKLQKDEKMKNSIERANLELMPSNSRAQPDTVDAPVDSRSSMPIQGPSNESHNPSPQGPPPASSDPEYLSGQHRRRKFGDNRDILWIKSPARQHPGPPTDYHSGPAAVQDNVGSPNSSQPPNHHPVQQFPNGFPGYNNGPPVVQNNLEPPLMPQPVSHVTKPGESVQPTEAATVPSIGCYNGQLVVQNNFEPSPMPQPVALVTKPSEAVQPTEAATVPSIDYNHGPLYVQNNLESSPMPRPVSLITNPGEAVQPTEAATVPSIDYNHGPLYVQNNLEPPTMPQTVSFVTKPGEAVQPTEATLAPLPAKTKKKQTRKKKEPSDTKKQPRKQRTWKSKSDDKQVLGGQISVLPLSSGALMNGSITLDLSRLRFSQPPQELSPPPQHPNLMPAPKPNQPPQCPNLMLPPAPNPPTQKPNPQQKVTIAELIEDILNKVSLVPETGQAVQPTEAAPVSLPAKAIKKKQTREKKEHSDAEKQRMWKSKSDDEQILGEQIRVRPLSSGALMNGSISLDFPRLRFPQSPQELSPPQPQRPNLMPAPKPNQPPQRPNLMPPPAPNPPTQKPNPQQKVTIAELIGEIINGESLVAETGQAVQPTEVAPVSLPAKAIKKKQTREKKEHWDAKKQRMWKSKSDDEQVLEGQIRVRPLSPGALMNGRFPQPPEELSPPPPPQRPNNLMPPSALNPPPQEPNLMPPPAPNPPPQRPDLMPAPAPNPPPQRPDLMPPPAQNPLPQELNLMLPSGVNSPPQRPDLMPALAPNPPPHEPNLMPPPAVNPPQQEPNPPRTMTIEEIINREIYDGLNLLR